MKFLPDWTEPKLLTLVYPVGMESDHERTTRDTVLPLFNNLMEALNNHEINLSVQIIYQSQIFNSETPYKIKQLYPNLNIINESLELNDIWIRDWAALSVQNEVSRTLIKAKYEPSYTFSRPVKDHLAGQKLQLNLSSNLHSIPLAWDFGNLTTNGKDIIITEQLSKENALTKPQLEKILRQNFQFNQLVLIPVEKYDNIGHADSVCRFLDEKTIILPSYPDYFIDESNYIKELYAQCNAEFTTKYDYVFIDSDLSEVVNKEGIYSAEGNYLNYLRLGQNLYLPQYGLSHDKEAIRILKKRTKLNIIPIQNCSSLAFLGGVLNCYTWTTY